jgi:hypothetical protein
LARLVACAIKEYEGLLEKHVSSDMREKTDILKLLLSKGKLVFVPKKWERIKNIPSLELR